jgi:biopolymer transport protein ExbB
MTLLAACPVLRVAAEEAAKTEAAKGGAKEAGFWAMAKHAGFMEYILVLVSIAGLALLLQSLVTIRVQLLRPPHIADELINLVSERNLDEALEAAQNDQSFLGVVAFATLSNAQFGKEAMEAAMSDAGELEGAKVLNRIGMLNLIAAIAPMLGLTGTVVGMIDTFSQLSAKSDSANVSDMAGGIGTALVCTFTGLFIAIPLLIVAFILKSRVTQVMHEISNDCGEMIRIITGGEQAEA